LSGSPHRLDAKAFGKGNHYFTLVVQYDLGSPPTAIKRIAIAFIHPETALAVIPAGGVKKVVANGLVATISIPDGTCAEINRLVSGTTAGQCDVKAFISEFAVSGDDSEANSLMCQRPIHGRYPSQQQ
jgi:hypothetical protein